MNIKGKLTAYSLLLGLVPLLLASVVSGWIASNGLHATGEDHLSAIRDAKKQQVELYFDQIRNQVVTLAHSTMIEDATVAFTQAFKHYGATTQLWDTGKKEATDHASLKRYYQEQFGGRYREVNGKDIDTAGLLPKSSQALALQSAYIADNPHPLGEKHLLDAVEDGSLYGVTHKRYHPSIRDYLEKFGYYDIFLVDLDSGNIVYSVFKELDFATSLKDGPYADTNFAEAYRLAAASETRGEAFLVDFAHYAPSYEAPRRSSPAPSITRGRRSVYWCSSCPSTASPRCCRSAPAWVKAARSTWWASTG